MTNNYPGGVWPVMLTPFTTDNRVDYNALGELIEWYIANGVSGLFAVCQSSEMFYLSLEERLNITRFVVAKVKGRIPIIASGHISDTFDEQVNEIIEIGNTGVDATILITNRFAKENEDEDVWISNLERLLYEIPLDRKLGFYECPYPYKRILSKRLTQWCANTGRFYFIKDTSCDINNIKDKLDVCKGTNMKLYNANTSTLLESLKSGAAGYSGVMANMQCSLYVKLCSTYKHTDYTELIQELSICALIERQCYPANAKYYLQMEGLNITSECRSMNKSYLNNTFKEEIKMLRQITERMNRKYLKG